MVSVRMQHPFAPLSDEVSHLCTWRPSKLVGPLHACRMTSQASFLCSIMKPSVSVNQCCEIDVCAFRLVCSSLSHLNLELSILFRNLLMCFLLKDRVHKTLKEKSDVVLCKQIIRPHASALHSYEMTNCDHILWLHQKLFLCSFIDYSEGTYVMSRDFCLHNIPPSFMSAVRFYAIKCWSPILHIAI